MLATYLAFCGMAVSNAQAIEAYTREYDRNKVSKVLNEIACHVVRHDSGKLAPSPGVGAKSSGVKLLLPQTRHQLNVEANITPWLHAALTHCYPFLVQRRFCWPSLIFVAMTTAGGIDTEHLYASSSTFRRYSHTMGATNRTVEPRYTWRLKESNEKSYSTLSIPEYVHYNIKPKARIFLRCAAFSSDKHGTPNTASATYCP